MVEMALKWFKNLKLNMLDFVGIQINPWLNVIGHLIKAIRTQWCQKQSIHLRPTSTWPKSTWIWLKPGPSWSAKPGQPDQACAWSIRAMQAHSPNYLGASSKFYVIEVSNFGASFLLNFFSNKAIQGLFELVICQRS